MRLVDFASSGRITPLDVGAQIFHELSQRWGLHLIGD